MATRKNAPQKKTPAKKSSNKKQVASKAKGSAKKRSLKWRFFVLLLKLFFVFTIFFSVYVVYLDFLIKDKFEGKKWSLPARVYARPLELYQGLKISPDQLISELKALKYRYGFHPLKEGTYSQKGISFRIKGRSFVFGDAKEKPQPVKVAIRNNEIVSIKHAVNGADVDIVRLDPALIASIYPNHNEDRILVKIDKVPEKLKAALIAVEDRYFYSHYGVAPLSIMRAMYINLKAGRVVQGGSTLTQQLVKNFYLSSEKTLVRKVNEAIMAVLLDYHYEKDKILEAYINEIFMGQDGKRAIHGFGLAGRYYFDKDLEELNAAEIALIVGMVRGASYYDPRRHPQRAKNLRNLVLDIMAGAGIISKKELAVYKKKKLGIVKKDSFSRNRYPAFVDVVKQQLHKDYKDQDLRSEGLRIFTTLAPYVQKEAEIALNKRIKRLGKKNLEAAVVITRADNAELLAIIGGRDLRYSGFNRALNAKRQVGSLIKPAVYLTALANPEKYNLATPLSDKKFSLKDKKGHVWTPKNYDRQERESVALMSALIKSYNIATVRLGAELGIDKVVATLEDMGVSEDEIPHFPSLFLGAIQLSPFQVAQLYQSLATGGFDIRIRAVREVLDVDNKPLQRYPLEVKKRFPAAAVYLTVYAMQKVVEEGTAKGLSRYLQDLGIAGKTGTTNDTRDSWFAGFSGDKLAVVWVGRDNNKSTGLTGAGGAMQIWGEFMKELHPAELRLLPPEDIIEIKVDLNSGKEVDDYCKHIEVIPVKIGTKIEKAKNCKVNGIKGFFQKILN